MSAQTHRSEPQVLNRRTLAHDHRLLASLLRPGMDVLDVGCGTGAITAGIACRVGPTGRVTGVDRDESLLSMAVREHSGLSNLSFERGDATSLPFEACCDIVTAARTLQWISEPGRALTEMTKGAKPGGLVVVLDYNHVENQWEPEPPTDFVRFYRAFLDWRARNCWNNRMGSALPALLEEAGLTEVRSHAQDETAARGGDGFSEAAGIWSHVIDQLGSRMVAAGFLSEAECVAARKAYAGYRETALVRQTLALRAVQGRKRPHS